MGINRAKRGAFHVRGLHFFRGSYTLTEDFSDHYLSMPITTSAKKALRQSKRKRIANVRSLTKIKTIAKEVRFLVQGKKFAEAQALLPRLYAAIDKAAKENVIKKNTASRKKSRITVSVNKAAAQK